MIGGSSGVTIKKIEEHNMEGGSSTIINVNQIRGQKRGPNSQGLQSSRIMEKRSGIMSVVGGGNTGTNQRGNEDEGDSREGHSIVSDEQYKEENPKVMKASLQLKNALFLNEEAGAPTTLNVPEERKMLKAPHFGQKREAANYRNYINTFTINNAHSDQINCMCSLRNGIFVTGSNDKTIKAWTPLESKPLGVLEEDAPITHFIKTGKPN